MSPAQLTVEAEKVVAATQRKLPAEVRAKAVAVPVVCHDRPSEAILGDEFEPDILGMFVGEPHGGAGAGEGSAVPAHILLFLENLYDYAEGDIGIFRDEVRLTYLHELGHFFGWDEDELEARGLG
jgi:predicted Zn-dependent protease with MMP-like domain